MPVRTNDVVKGETTEVFPIRDFVGKTDSIYYRVPTDAKFARVSYDTAAFPDDETLMVLEVNVFLSYDPRGTSDELRQWGLLFGFKSRGGILREPRPSGFTGTRGVVGHTLHGAGRTGRVLRVEYTALVPIRSDFDLRVE